MRRPFKVLSFLLAALVLANAVALADLLRRRPGGYRVSAYFDKAIGLFENSKVMILGVPVGTVTSIRPQGGRVRVDMEISDEHKIPADAIAHIVPISLVADRYVQFEPVYRGGPVLADGAVLDESHTRIPAELDDVFNQLDKLLDALEPGRKGDPGALGELIVQLDAALEGREQDVRGTLVQTAKLTRTLAAARSDLSGVLVNLDDLFSRLATRAQGITALNRNLAIVMTTLARSRGDLEATLADTGRMTAEIGDLIRDHRGRLAKDVALASRIAATIVANRASVVEALRWLPVAGRGFANAYHPGEVDSLDVRDNTTAGVCDMSFADAPPALTQGLRQLQREACGDAPLPANEHRSRENDVAKQGATPTCRQNLRRIRRDLRALSELGLPREVEQQTLGPLQRKARRLAKRCRDLDSAFDRDAPRPPRREGPDVGRLPEIEEGLDRQLEGSAAGATFAPQSAERDDNGEGWVDRLLRFLGWRA